MLSIILCLICACQATQGTNNELLNSDSEYDKVEIFNFDDVEYLFFVYQVTFDEARVICLNYKAQLAVLNTKEKADFVARAMTNTLELGEFWIGAQSDNGDSWYWFHKKQKLNLDHTFYGDLKIWDSLGVSSNNENCLMVCRKRHSTPTFVPLQCSKKRPFICQREIDRFETRANEMDVIKVNDEEFTLYSARATWAEAVVQCRQKGLQIAEIKSKKVAQAVAMSMLRARPDAMENVWIGGYLKGKSWEWLASSDKITVNELWPNDTRLLTGCLLLDRHVCEDPVYDSTNCDRKRHILCQKPLIKLISKIPSPINVNGCPYWIGFYPLEWLDAKRACQAVNASLVILDSPKIIDDMMTIMVDYKEELRHIWTDGHRRKSNADLVKKINQEIWYWSSTDERVPTSDRENHKTPVVYGLNCRKKQTYVCQPWTGHCISHRVQEDLLKNYEFLNLYSSLVNIKPVKMPAIALSLNSSRGTQEDVSYVYEDMSNMQKLHSSESYYTSSVAFSIPHQVTYLLEKTTQSIKNETRKFYNPVVDKFPKDGEEKYDNEKEILKIKTDEVNQTNSQNLISDFLSPLFHFTLPSLPQFGIKVVSAEVTTPKSEVKKISGISKPKGTTSKNFTRSAKIDNHTQVTKSNFEDSKKTSSNLTQNKGDKNKKVISEVADKNVGLAKNLPKAKVKSLVAGKLYTTVYTTEKMDDLSSGGLYGDDIDYSETSSSGAENTEITTPSEDYVKLIKSLEASGKLISLLNEDKKSSKLGLSLLFAEMLRKRINDEVKSVLKSELQSELKNTSQQTPVEPTNLFGNPEFTNKPKELLTIVDTNRMDLKNMEMNKNHNVKRPYEHDSIPPYYASKSPLRVKLLDNGTGIPISPTVSEIRSNFDENNSEKLKEKLIITPKTDQNNNSFDFQFSNFNPHDKNSMLQLGRFLKDMFAGRNPNAQQIDFNLITRRDISATSKVIIDSENETSTQKNNLQDPVSQNENNREITTVTTTIVTATPQSANENKNLKNCQKELDYLKRTTSSETSSDNLRTDYLQEQCQYLPIPVPPAPSRIPRMSFENVNDYSYQSSYPNAESFVYNVFKHLVKGIRIDIREIQLKNYMIKFVREILLNPKEFNFNSDSGTSWHEPLKKILNSLNGTAIRFHGEKVQLRFGSFGYKKKSKPKLKVVTYIRTTASPEMHLYTTRGLQTRIGIYDGQDQIHQIQNPWSDSDPSGIIEDPLNNIHVSKYLFTPVQPTNNDLNNHSKHRIISIVSNVRRLKQKNKPGVGQPDRSESNTKRWSHLRIGKEKLKEMKQVQETESMPENRDFENKIFSYSGGWKTHRTLGSGEDIKQTTNFRTESKNFDEVKLQISNKLSKKSITDANAENPFPDFPVINFDIRRAEDSFKNGFETIRVGKASTHVDLSNVSSIVSVYVLMKHQNNAESEKYSLPILEFHVRMPAHSLPVGAKYSPDYRARKVEHDQIQESKIPSNPRKLDLKIIHRAQATRRRKTTEEFKITKRRTTQEPQKRLKSQKSRKLRVQTHNKQRNEDQIKDLDLKNMKNHTDLNSEKANDFLTTIFENVTNFKSVADLRRKRLLLYLALKYLRHVADERLENKPNEGEENSLKTFMKLNNEFRQVNRNSMPNSNLRVQDPFPEVQNLQQVPLYPGLDNRMLFNQVENDLNPNRGLLNQMPLLNYNTRRYNDMPFKIIKRSYNLRMRRNVESSKNSKSRTLFLDNKEYNKNQNNNP
ncbi:uncharacterized protein LOC117168167 isoform X2 [Belonocnema kinseyi]|uniref:uncharacterized protein LOC117168167 isoform X2 n=1 Tax=Belonocnema kinseyi TaxID=2817044 RepID=UPI00143E0778|nr:uncharacterized protein LOC117168167 isoform X2 [Belonocnema kinseyi]